MSKIFVGNFSFSLDSDKLKEYFGAAGTVVSAKVMTEGEGGRSRGFGFVEMSSQEEAQKAIADLNGSTWEGRQIKVSEDRGPRRHQGAPGASRPPSGDNRGGGRPSGGGHFGGGAPRYDRGSNRGGQQDRSSAFAPMGYFRAQPLDMGTRRRRKLDPFLEDPKLVIDYKDPRLLKRFLSERGKILPQRMTGLSAAHQRQVARAIKRAQHLALLSFTEG